MLNYILALSIRAVHDTRGCVGFVVVACGTFCVPRSEISICNYLVILYVSLGTFINLYQPPITSNPLPGTCSSLAPIDTREHYRALLARLLSPFLPVVQSIVTHIESKTTIYYRRHTIIAPSIERIAKVVHSSCALAAPVATADTK